jgi:hypothetical protein
VAAAKPKQTEGRKRAAPASATVKVAARRPTASASGINREEARASVKAGASGVAPIAPAIEAREVVPPPAVAERGTPPPLPAPIASFVF